MEAKLKEEIKKAEQMFSKIQGKLVKGSKSIKKITPRPGDAFEVQDFTNAQIGKTTTICVRAKMTRSGTTHNYLFSRESFDSMRESGALTHDGKKYKLTKPFFVNNKGFGGSTSEDPSFKVLNDLKPEQIQFSVPKYESLFQGYSLKS